MSSTLTAADLPFFPFINMTGTFLCIGIGADDLFVMIQAFDDAIRQREKCEPGKRGLDADLVQAALREAGAATFVTSMSTAGAFFASASSGITAIKCFGVFCGLVVMCDWLMMVRTSRPDSPWCALHCRAAADSEDVRSAPLP